MEFFLFLFRYVEQKEERKRERKWPVTPGQLSRLKENNLPIKKEQGSQFMSFGRESRKEEENNNNKKRGLRYDTRISTASSKDTVRECVSRECGGKELDERELLGYSLKTEIRKRKKFLSIFLLRFENLEDMKIMKS